MKQTLNPKLQTLIPVPKPCTMCCLAHSRRLSAEPSSHLGSLHPKIFAILQGEELGKGLGLRLGYRVGVWVQGLGLGFRIWGLGFRVWGLGFRV